MRMPALREPIVFVHGFMGFDYLRLGRWRLACYWSRLPDSLRASGNRVLIPKVAPLGTVAERAAQLKAYLDEHLPHEPFHLIGHSMGGLDSRYLISRLGFAPRVLSLTTIATPHHGTPFADWGLRRLAPVFRHLLDIFGISLRSVQDLTTEACRRFNDETPDAPNVVYSSVGGRFESSWRTPAWHLPWRVIRDHSGDNDGLVPVASAGYGEHFDRWDGNHLSLVNFPDPFAKATGRWKDRTPAFAGLLNRLKAKGF